MLGVYEIVDCVLVSAEYTLDMKTMLGNNILEIQRPLLGKTSDTFKSDVIMTSSLLKDQDRWVCGSHRVRRELYEYIKQATVHLLRCAFEKSSTATNKQCISCKMNNHRYRDAYNIPGTPIMGTFCIMIAHPSLTSEDSPVGLVWGGDEVAYVTRRVAWRQQALYSQVPQLDTSHSHRRREGIAKCKQKLFTMTAVDTRMIP